MKKFFKTIVFFGLAASLSSLSAEEAKADSTKEMSMSQTPDRCITPDDCRGTVFDLECNSREEEYDYDVYTVGSDGESCEKPAPAPCKKSCPEKRSKSKCDTGCKRKGAAKAAQE